MTSDKTGLSPVLRLPDIIFYHTPFWKLITSWMIRGGQRGTQTPATNVPIGVFGEVCGAGDKRGCSL